MNAHKGLMDVITTVLILMEAIIVLVWMDMNWNQIITLVQVITNLLCTCICMKLQFRKSLNLHVIKLMYLRTCIICIQVHDWLHLILHMDVAPKNSSVP